MISDEEQIWQASTDIRAILGMAAARLSQRKLACYFIACAENLLRSHPAADRSTILLPAIRAAADADIPPFALPHDVWEWERDEVETLLRLAESADVLTRQIAVQTDKTLAAGFLADVFPRDERWWELPREVDAHEPWLTTLIQTCNLRRERIAVNLLPHLRDIAGNPFRPVAFDPAWRTEAVVGLARGMYESRDFAPMPVLADALEDAGCADPDILSHCRTPGLHIRGCWVVDLVLGKS